MLPVKRTVAPFALLATLAAACSRGALPEEVLARGEQGMTEDWFRANLPPGSPDATSVLALLNDPGMSPGAYVATCGFTGVQAEAIVDYRAGDAPADAADDQRFETLGEVDRLPFTNEAFWTAALACGRAHYPPLPSTGGHGCPPPARIGPTQLPPGFLPAVRIARPFMTDGDSGYFDFPTVLGARVRMLYVNTEETGGDQMTLFGVQTKSIVIEYVSNAADVQIAVQESWPGSGQPKSDPFGRWLALVFVDGDLLQTRLVREGLSAYYTVYGCAAAPVHDALLHAEAEANASKRGIWGPGPHNDYRVVLGQWVGPASCRPNPFFAPYCAVEP